MTGLLIAAPKEAVLGNVRAIQGAGLTATDVDLVPFALTRALVTGAGVIGTVAVVDIGAETTTTVVVKATAWCTSCASSTPAARRSRRRS